MCLMVVFLDGKRAKERCCGEGDSTKGAVILVENSLFLAQGMPFKIVTALLRVRPSGRPSQVWILSGCVD